MDRRKRKEQQGKAVRLPTYVRRQIAQVDSLQIGSFRDY
jgi:hypothetical protein